MSAVDALKTKLAEFERKGILGRFLEDYQHRPLDYTIRQYKISYLLFSEVKQYLETKYNISHVNQNQKKRLR